MQHLVFPRVASAPRIVNFHGFILQSSTLDRLAEDTKLATEKKQRTAKDTEKDGGSGAKTKQKRCRNLPSRVERQR